MIIDLILDRKDGKQYIPRDFYNSVMNYGVIGHEIASALDGGDEDSVQRALTRYIVDNGYCLDRVAFITSNQWLQ